MIQTATTNIIKWLAIAFFAALAGLMLYRNEQLSESVEALEAEIANLQTNDSAPTIKPAEQTILSEQPTRPVGQDNRKDAPAGLISDETDDSDHADNLADITEALAKKMLAHGSLSETMGDLELRFSEEAVDPGWSTQQVIEVQTEFVNCESLVSYNLSNLECRTTMCKGEVQSLGDQPFDDYGASIAAALTGFESVKLVKMQIQGREATTAQVFFEKNDASER